MHKHDAVLLILVLVLSALVMPTLVDLAHYAQIVVVDGDCLNDWATHLPEWAESPVVTVCGALTD